MLHVKDREWDENHQGDDFLQDFQWCQIQLLMTDAIGRYLKLVLEQRDSPGSQRGKPPVAVVEILQVGVSGVIGLQNLVPASLLMEFP